MLNRCLFRQRFFYVNPMKFSDEFKEAILHLPEREKDKLLLRLLKKDRKLVKRMEFELLQPCSVETARESLQQDLVRHLQQLAQRPIRTKLLLKELRQLSGKITEHVYTTRDNYGDVQVSLVMMQTLFETTPLAKWSQLDADLHKLHIYLISKLYKVLIALRNMHEDLRFDFQEQLDQLAQHLANEPNLLRTASRSGLELSWFQVENIPENLGEILRTVRSEGRLK